MAKMIHTMLRVKEATRSIKFYHEVFQLREKRRVELDDFSLIYLGNVESDFELELTCNHNQENSYQLGNGYGHLAFAQTHISLLHELAESLGYSPNDIQYFYNKNRLVAKFFFIEDPDGYKIEVIEKSSTYQ